MSAEQTKQQLSTEQLEQQMSTEQLEQQMPVEEEKIEAPTEIGIAKSLQVQQPEMYNIEKLYNELKNNFNKREKRGLSYYEYFRESQLVKPYIDYEEYMSQEDYNNNPEQNNETKDAVLTILNNLFETQDYEWAVARDTRKVMAKKDRHYGQIKISFHYVCWTKKIEIAKMKQFMTEKNYIFQSKGLEGVDIKVYRTGLSKFRLPYCKKTQRVDDKNSLLIPLNYCEDLDDFKKHLVAYIDSENEYHELKVQNIANVRNDRKMVDVNRCLLLNTKDTEEEIKAIIANYDTISEKNGTGQYEGMVLYNIPAVHCGKDHSHNHNMLIHNELTNTLKIKCHSDRCADFEKIIYEPKRPTMHFDIDHLNRIPMPTIDGVKDNYQQVKQYFEQFMIYIRDTNSYYRIRYEWNDKYQYYEKDIKGVNIDGYKEDLYYTELTEDGVQGRKNFYKRYRMDMCKNSYYNLYFQPHGPKKDGKISNGDYNIFGGFNYHNVLEYKQKNNIPQEKVDDFHFLLEHIKDYICGRKEAMDEEDPVKKEKALKESEDLYNYFLEYQANIVQEPTNLPQIILVLYSKTNGTGKSGFTKFFSGCIGPDLSYFGSFDQITQTHSHAHVGKLFNVIEEVDRKVTRQNNNIIKDISQREVAIYNEKNKPQHRIKTYVRYMMTTNYHNGVYFDDEDRRYVVYTFTKCNDMAHINRLQNVLEDPYVVYQYGKMLETYQLTYKRPSDWIKARPLTQDYYNMRSEDSVDVYMKDLIKLDSLEMDCFDDITYRIGDVETENKKIGTDCIAIIKSEMYSHYQTFHRENNASKPKGRTTFYNYIQSNLKSEVKIVKMKNKKSYFVLNLKKLWEKYFPTEKYANAHAAEYNKEEE